MNPPRSFESGGSAGESASLPRGIDEPSRKLLLRNRHLAAPEDLSIGEARKQMLDGQETTLDRSSIYQERFTYTGCKVLIVRSLRATGLCPPVFFLHGGGWLMGDEKTHAYLIMELAERSDCAIVFIDYPRSPEVRFPQSQDVAFSAICEVLADAGKHQIDPKRFAFAGDSAGGNIAACLALRFRQERLDGPKAQVLIYPALDARLCSASYRAFGKGLNLTKNTMRWFWELYANGNCSFDEPLYSPLSADNDMLRGLPDTLVITSEFDVLRDEGEEFAKRLRDNGVDVCSIRFGGVLHGFMVTESLAKSSSGDVAIQVVADYLRRRLNAN